MERNEVTVGLTAGKRENTNIPIESYLLTILVSIKVRVDYWIFLCGYDFKDLLGELSTKLFFYFYSSG